LVNPQFDRRKYSLPRKKISPYFLSINILIVNKVCDEINTPASFIVKHGILMLYDKNIQLDELEKRIKESDFSDIAQRTINLIVANHCFSHPVTYGNKQRIEKKLKIPTRSLTGSYKEVE
jgi:hypothetical protein